MAVGYNPNPVSIGSRRLIATLLSNSPVDDGAGGQVDNYAAVLTTRCSLQKMSGGFSVQQGTVFMDKRYKMYCLYQAAIKNAINTDILWQIQSDTYRVIDVTKVDEIPQFYEFILQKQ